MEIIALTSLEQIMADMIWLDSVLIISLKLQLRIII